MQRTKKRNSKFVGTGAQLTLEKQYKRNAY